MDQLRTAAALLALTSVLLLAPAASAQAPFGSTASAIACQGFVKASIGCWGGDAAQLGKLCGALHVVPQTMGAEQRFVEHYSCLQDQVMSSECAGHDWPDLTICEAPPAAADPMLPLCEEMTRVVNVCLYDAGIHGQLDPYRNCIYTGLTEESVGCWIDTIGAVDCGDPAAMRQLSKTPTCDIDTADELPAPSGVVQACQGYIESMAGCVAPGVATPEAAIACKDMVDPDGSVAARYECLAHVWATSSCQGPNVVPDFTPCGD